MSHYHIVSHLDWQPNRNEYHVDIVVAAPYFSITWNLKFFLDSLLI